ncbi:hypothetical protein KIN20_027564 [Parelaphostrongylus tenuis]|uniref:Uncharacterized protein n=1 Tax=Parelaphostrongylus tenuis TaxID=148309 RepID=A0AAD5QZR6_PARTN|nr:hypothetical protein KIN20_027564 [Parelaphostrongylus tenuis]
MATRHSRDEHCGKDIPETSEASRGHRGPYEGHCPCLYRGHLEVLEGTRADTENSRRAVVEHVDVRRASREVPSHSAS